MRNEAENRSEEPRLAVVAAAPAASQNLAQSLLASIQGLFRRDAARRRERIPCAAVDPILQQVVYGQRDKVEEMLEQLKRENPALLKEVLTSVATQPIVDYSGRKIENCTLLQAAVAAGDMAIHCHALGGMVEMIQSYFIDNTEIASQLARLFPDGIDAHKLEQERNTFDFSAIVAAFVCASAGEIYTASRLVGAQFEETASARVKKDDDPTFTLTDALNRFRWQFREHVMNEEIFNPRHFSRAYAIYSIRQDRLKQMPMGVREEKRCDVFLRQVIGYTQRFFPACYAQAFSQGLYFALTRHFTSSFCFKYNSTHYFYPLPRGCSGVGFDLQVPQTIFPSEHNRRWTVYAGYYETYVEKKQQTLCQLLQTHGLDITAAAAAPAAAC